VRAGDRMSQLLIQQYLNELSDLRRVSGTSRESVVREAFKTLLKGEGRARDLIFVTEYEIATPARERRYVDGALLHELRVPFGYWEAKDEKDDLDEEIAFKFRRGYPQDNIIFEDSHQAVLIQNKQEVMRCPVDDVDRLARLLGLFFSYERAEIAEFRKAVTQFKIDLPAVLGALRDMIDGAHRDKPDFRAASVKFLKHAQDTINPNVTAADVREMLIQHVLTEEIFSQVFDNSDFHRQNNVAKELYALEGTFFTGGLKHKTLEGLRSYYAAIRSAAVLVSSHHEKQTFLKVIYENFYKVYNKKAADRLGVVYTPSEIVRFMIESADWLCQTHFGKRLIDRQVEILDPAAGTGTFIAELIEHFRGQPAKLKHKYLEELHANEVAILPYYVANLNIEATYAAITGDYEEFPNLCFVDTLDNVAGLRQQRGQQGNLFGAVSEENVARIKRQNARRISVVIGNPPYNANQLNENENNKNREYPAIDKQIKETYIAASTAQKTKLYDMYVRFFRWASDRVEENGIVALVTNSSFVHRPSFDGFRRTMVREFNDIWIVDLKGDARSSGESRRREGGNIFGDQIKVGIAISFFIKKQGASGCRIRYEAVRDHAKADEKSDFLKIKPIGERQFENLTPDPRGNWINVADNGFGSLLAIADKDTKSVKVSGQERAIFRLYSLGISTNRDEWMYDLERGHLEKKIRHLVKRYDEVSPASEEFPDDIKWSETLKRRKQASQSEAFDKRLIRRAAYRPFFGVCLYQSPLFIDRPGLADALFPPGKANSAICFSDVGSRTDYCVLAIDGLADLHFGAAVDAYQQAPRFRFVDGERVDNITDWALEQFRAHYEREGKKPKRPIAKDAIFRYVYAVLHDPAYREKYALNLRREFPRIPFYADFWRWAAWGEKLMQFHIGYETVEPWPLRRVDTPDERSRKAGLKPKAMLRANKDIGNIQLDSETQLTGIPAEAWTYRLGNRSALEWILDQHKEKKPKDPTIREKFNTYRFADHKEKVIDLLMRVTTVSVETQKIVAAMKERSDIR
jgi:predicted helicase